MNLSNLLFGIILLVAGRRLFWLFVGIVGFLAGMTYAGQLFPDAPDWMVLLIAIGLGILGAVFAVAAQWVVVVMAGFVGGGHLAVLIIQLFSPTADLFNVVFLLGGVIGAILVIVAFDLAIIVISSLMGAALIMSQSGLKDPLILTLGILGAALAGIMIQSALVKVGPKRS